MVFDSIAICQLFCTKIGIIAVFLRSRAKPIFWAQFSSESEYSIKFDENSFFFSQKLFKIG
jgi:hypothetical protein